jgi:glycosyl transferase family 25
MLSASWRCFVINLDRSPQRLAAIGEQLAALNMPFTRFRAVDGAGIDPETAPDFHAPRYRKRHGKRPCGREIGCFMSHLGVMRAFLETDARFCLILEDDAVLDAALPPLLEQLRAAAADWDVALLYGNYPGLPQRLRRLGPRHELVGFLARQTGAVAYAVNRRAARAYLDQLLPMSLPIDVDFDRAWDFGIRFRGVAPFPVRTGRHPSDIGRVGDKFAWYRRLGTYARRGLNELRRYRHYLLRDPIWLAAWQFRLAQRAQARQTALVAGFYPHRGGLGAGLE